MSAMLCAPTCQIAAACEIGEACAFDDCDGEGAVDVSDGGQTRDAGRRAYIMPSPKSTDTLTFLRNGRLIRAIGKSSLRLLTRLHIG